MRLLGPTPFTYLSKCVLKLNEKYHEDADWIVDQIHEYGKFIALHVRSYYSINEDISITFKCINKLLKMGIVSKAFVLTDNLDYEKKARKLIRPTDALVTMVKELERSYTQDSISRGFTFVLSSSFVSFLPSFLPSFFLSFFLVTYILSICLVFIKSSLSKGDWIAIT